MELQLYSSSLLLLLLLLSSHGLHATEGSRALHFQTKDPPKVGKGVAAVAESLIGSRPPRCEGKCAPCGRCEAVQVPVAPRVDGGGGEAEPGRARLFGGVAAAAAAAGDRVQESYADYKPLNWKCRCADRRALDP